MRNRRLSKRDVDFRWAKNQPPSTQALAAWYEYARESPPLIERVCTLRQARMFSPKNADASIIREHATKHLQIIPLQQLRLLVCCSDFPTKAFRDVRWSSDLRLMLDSKTFATDGPVALPWTTYFGLRKLDLSDAYAKWHLHLGRSIHPISIPWHYTNAELSRMFEPMIRRLRPQQFPEPPRAGRRGRGKSLGGLEFLQQLSAFRLRERSILFDDPTWRNLHIYKSRRGYENAAKAARARIDKITAEPFFDTRN